MAKIKTTPWTPAIDTPEDVVNYLEAALEDGDPDLIVTMLGYIARSRGMGCANRARGACLAREPLQIAQRRPQARVCDHPQSDGRSGRALAGGGDREEITRRAARIR